MLTSRALLVVYHRKRKNPRIYKILIKDVSQEDETNMDRLFAFYLLYNQLTF